jgi:uncharacterized membrane protein YsdA (DUF1294 family)/cold shock CspA family protein
VVKAEFTSFCPWGHPAKPANPSDIIAALRSQAQRGIAAFDVLPEGPIACNDKSGFSRVSVLIPLEAELFDQLMNGNSGYRAYYAAGLEYGEAFNRALVEAVGPCIVEAEHLYSDHFDRAYCQSSLLGRFSKFWYPKSISDKSAESALLRFREELQVPAWQAYWRNRPPPRKGPARHLGREALRPIMRLAAQAPCRFRPLSSNVRPRSNPMRLDGNLKTWNDDRGFGFIEPAQGGQEIFVHIKAFPGGTGRPVVGQALTFEVEVGPTGKKRAHSVQYPVRSRMPRLLILPVFIGICIYVATHWPVRPLLFALYAGMSVLAFLAYGFDKAAARRGRWRTSENTLHLLGLAGGWPGALLAQQLLRHKSSKPSFVAVYWLTVTANIVAFLAWHVALQGRV